MKFPMHLAPLVVAGLSAPASASAALTAVDASQLQGGILTSAGITVRMGTESVFLANNGQTAVIQKTDPLQNVLINTASNVTLNQQVDATLVISGMDALATMRLSDAIGAVVGARTLGAPGN